MPLAPRRLLFWVSQRELRKFTQIILLSIWNLVSDNWFKSKNTLEQSGETSGIMVNHFWISFMDHLKRLCGNFFLNPVSIPINFDFKRRLINVAIWKIHNHFQKCPVSVSKFNQIHLWIWAILGCKRCFPDLKTKVINSLFRVKLPIVAGLKHHGLKKAQFPTQAWSSKSPPSFAGLNRARKGARVRLEDYPEPDGHVPTFLTTSF